MRKLATLIDASDQTEDPKIKIHEGIISDENSEFEDPRVQEFAIQ
jgi:hypothetical protein